MRSKTFLLTLGTAVVAVAIGAGGYWVSRPSSVDVVSQGVDSRSALFAYADDSGLGQTGLPDSSDRVSVDAWFPGPVASDGSRDVRVRLHIDPAWHVNANPASLEALIPTTIQAQINGQTVPLEATYPPGRDSDIRLGDTTIKVYDDSTMISAVLAPETLEAAEAAGGVDLLVQVQSCSDEGICLAPTRLVARLPQS